MGSITVPIVARRAKSAWRAPPLTTELGRIQLCLTGDGRLLAGIAGAVNHVAEAAGLEEKSRADLIAAVEDICEEAVASAPPGKAQIALTLEALPGAIQAVLEFPKPSAAKPTPSAKEQAARRHLDSLNREANGDKTRVTLTKKIK